MSLATERASVTYDPSILAGVRDIVDAIEDTGFDATLASDENNAMQLKSLARTKEITEWKDAFLRAVSFGVPVFLLSMVFPMVPFLRPLVDFALIRGIYLGDLVCLVLTLPVQFGVGLRFYRSAWRALKHQSATMDVLVVLGTSAAFLYSVLAMLAAPWASDPAYHPKVFFDTCTMLITFISFGRYLENVAKGQTSTALSRLMSLAPSQAIIYTDAECTKEKKVPTELIQVNDVVKIVPGDKIPADGLVVRGESSVDESMVTGEVVPVVKSVKSSVIGGTVNGQGTFDMRVTRAGKDTALAQIVHLVEEAQTSKAPIQAFADTVAGYFVPVVISLSLATFVAWMIVAHVASDLPHVFAEKGSTKFMVCLRLCISVVVVACPCALGLSTPTAVMVGTGVGAQHGILIKGAGPLEASHRVDRIVLDKTGTITVGKLDVVGVRWVERTGLESVEAEELAPASGGRRTRSSCSRPPRPSRSTRSPRPSRSGACARSDSKRSPRRSRSPRSSRSRAEESAATCRATSPPCRPRPARAARRTASRSATLRSSPSSAASRSPPRARASARARSSSAARASPSPSTGSSRASCRSPT